MTEEKKVVATRLVRCPKCRKSVRFDVTNEWRPFCSPLCKNEDIIAWAEGSHAIPGEPVDPEGMMPMGEDEES